MENVRRGPTSFQNHMPIDKQSKPIKIIKTAILAFKSNKFITSPLASKQIFIIFCSALRNLFGKENVVKDVIRRFMLHCSVLVHCRVIVV